MTTPLPELDARRPSAERVLEALTVAVLVLDRELRALALNPAAEMLLGVSARKARGTPVGELLGSGAEPIVTAFREALASGHPYTERGLALPLPGRAAVTVDCTVTPLGEPGGALLVELAQVDRPLRIAREERLLAQQQAAQAVLRNLAHEVRNPLGGIRGAAQLLERELGDPALREYTRIIIAEADRLRALVDRVLGQRGAPRRERLNIHEVLERVRRVVEVEAPPGVRIRRDYDPSLPELEGDADQLIQAVLNIVRNAVQAVGERGEILLRTRAERQLTLGRRRHRLAARVEIVDDGPGVPEAIRGEIFYPMITGRAEGTGLGLSIAQSIVQRHGGLIECESRPGRTVFTVFLPLEAGEDD
ncbi:MAG TPA: nitrogen regulation protein NR(II) [Chromatiales bacterium]|nr:nitrogen regulation protein NR(II) [Chromatiales bacterium]